MISAPGLGAVGGVGGVAGTGGLYPGQWPGGTGGLYPGQRPGGTGGLYPGQLPGGTGGLYPGQLPGGKIPCKRQTLLRIVLGKFSLAVVTKVNNYLFVVYCNLLFQQAIVFFKSC